MNKIFHHHAKFNVDPSKEEISEPLLDKLNFNMEPTNEESKNKMSEEHKPTWAGKHPLHRNQINQCMMEIDIDHPLKDTVKFDDIWPKLHFCRKYKLCKKGPNFRNGLRRTLLKEMELEIQKDDAIHHDNPF